MIVYRNDLAPRERVEMTFITATSLPLLIALAEIGEQDGVMLPATAAALVGAGRPVGPDLPAIAVGLYKSRTKAQVQPERLDEAPGLEPHGVGGTPGRRYGRASGQCRSLSTVRVELAEALDQPGHQAGPPGLVRGAEPGPVVAVEVLVEEDEVPPVRVLLEQPDPAVDRRRPGRRAGRWRRDGGTAPGPPRTASSSSPSRSGTPPSGRRRSTGSAGSAPGSAAG